MSSAMFFPDFVQQASMFFEARVHEVHGVVMKEQADILGGVEPNASSDAEVALLEIVRELLKNDSIGANDDFFLAGGHSLLGTQLVIRARKAFGVKISLRDLFATGTVAKLAVLVEERLVEELSNMSDEDIARVNEAT